MLTDRTFDVSRAAVVSSPGTHRGSEVGPPLFKNLSRCVLKYVRDSLASDFATTYHLALEGSIPFNVADMVIMLDGQTIIVEADTNEHMRHAKPD